MTKSTPTLTLTQSGLLAVLLQHQRDAVIQLARRDAHRKHLRTSVWSALTWPWRALMAPRLVGKVGFINVGLEGPRNTTNRRAP